jgi:hypothetical protein
MDSTSLVSNNLKTQSVADANKCAIKNTVQEPVDGCKSHSDSLEVELQANQDSIGLEKLPGGM